MKVLVYKTIRGVGVFHTDENGKVQEHFCTFNGIRLILKAFDDLAELYEEDGKEVVYLDPGTTTAEALAEYNRLVDRRIDGYQSSSPAELEMAWKIYALKLAANQ